jgi:opacity protein-like surface antigen
MTRIMILRRSAFVGVLLAWFTPAAIHAQFDISANFYEALTSASTGNGAKQTPTNSEGGMVEARYVLNHLAGFELAYSYNHANQTFAPNGTSCAYVCGQPAIPVTARADEIAADWVPSVKIGNLHPFAIGGIGFFITSPGDVANYDVNTVIRPVFVYGAGLDWSVMPHFGVRLQYRGNLYKAPDLTAIYPATGAYTQSAEPMGGLFYRF